MTYCLFPPLFLRSCYSLFDFFIMTVREASHCGVQLEVFTLFYTWRLFQNYVRTCHLVVVMTFLPSLFLSVLFMFYVAINTFTEERRCCVAFESTPLDGVLLLWLSTNSSKVIVPRKVRLQHDYNLPGTWCEASGLVTCLTTQYWDP